MRSIGILMGILCLLFVERLSNAAPATSGNNSQKQGPTQLTPTPSTDQNAADVYKKDLPSIVYIDQTATNGVEWTGTGFLAMKDGIVVTCWHVIHDAKTATARFPDGKVYDIVGVIDHDPDDDIALLKIDEAGRPMLSLQKNTPEIGSQTYLIGAPLGPVIIAVGTLDQLFKYRQTFDRYQTTCEVIEGDSGSPLVDEYGQVIGIISGGKATPTGHIGRAIPTKYILSLNDSLPVKPWKDVADIDPPETEKPNAPATAGNGQSR